METLQQQGRRLIAAAMLPPKVPTNPMAKTI
jgi:hypothetical protein